MKKGEDKQRGKLGSNDKNRPQRASSCPIGAVVGANDSPPATAPAGIPTASALAPQPAHPVTNARPKSVLVKQDDSQEVTSVALPPQLNKYRGGKNPLPNPLAPRTVPPAKPMIRRKSSDEPSSEHEVNTSVMQSLAAGLRKYCNEKPFQPRHVNMVRSNKYNVADEVADPIAEALRKTRTPFNLLPLGPCQLVPFNTVLIKPKETKPLAMKASEYRAAELKKERSAPSVRYEQFYTTKGPDLAQHQSNKDKIAFFRSYADHRNKANTFWKMLEDTQDKRKKGGRSDSKEYGGGSK